MNIKDILFNLSKTVSVGNIDTACCLAKEYLGGYCKTERLGNSVIGFIKGKNDYTLMLDAHIDQIAMIVTAVDDEGFLTLSNAGGIDIRMLPSKRVTVHGKEDVTAVFCATPPHLLKGEQEFSDISEIKLDTALGSKAKDIISVGDYVTFKSEPTELIGNRVCGTAFDNRASVACVIEIAKRLKDEELPFNVAFVLSDGEELGLRGVRPATFKISPDEAIILDVTFGDGIGISGDECGKLGKGPLIGLSPILSKEIGKKLKDISKEKNIPTSSEVMGRSTGTNADMVGISGKGVKTCTLSIPIRNMHTDVEILDFSDLESVCDLVCAYILSGGVMNV